MKSLKAKLHSAARQLGAAVTSPAVVKLEEKAAVLVAVRLLQAAGASAGLVILVQHLVH